MEISNQSLIAQKQTKQNKKDNKPLPTHKHLKLVPDENICGLHFTFPVKVKVQKVLSSL